MTFRSPSLHMSIGEVEFMAEHEMILIQPTFTLKENQGFLNCISGDYGPFHPQLTAKVPLWLALTLKKMHKCRIVQPSWLSVENLQMKLDSEKENGVFESMPYHYMEMASMLFVNASEDIEDLERIRTLIEDVQNLRQEKIRKGLQTIGNDVQVGGTAFAVQMNHVGAMEINSVRDFMIESLDRFYQVTGKNESGGNTQSSSQFTNSQGHTQEDYSTSQRSEQSTPFVPKILRRHRQ